MAMEALTAEQQAHVDKLIGDARVKARKLAQEEAAAAAGESGDEAQEALILKRIADAEEAAREAAKTELEAAATTAAAKAAEDAATAKLVEEKRWEDLATQHSATLAAQTAELEPLKAQVVAYQALVDSMLAEALEALGDAAKAAVDALPGEPTVQEKLVWLNQNEALFPDPKADPVGTPTSKKKAVAKKAGEGDTTTPRRVSRWPLKL